LVLQWSTPGESSDTGFVDAVFTNVVGRGPSVEELNHFVGLLQGGGWTQVTLLEFAATVTGGFDELNIELAGLQQEGLAFI
jgi:hypothetical protein